MELPLAAAPSWGALAGAIAVVIVAHWLIPRVTLPRMAARRRSRSLREDANPRRWLLTAVAGLGTYVILGALLGQSPATLAVWGIAFAAAMGILYARSAR